MARIPDQDRLAIVDAHITHWQQADAQNGSPIEIVAGYGVAQLQLQRTEFHDKQEEITQLESDAAAARADRDTVWGLSAEDENGVWFRLRQYKPLVRARLGARHPLSRTVPNLFAQAPRYYIENLHQFIDHWERVNAALTPDLTLGTFTLANLQTVHDTLLGHIQTVTGIDDARLPLAREEREQLFGDEPEDVREQTSIIARLVLYAATIEAMFPNQPLADSLPGLFPSGGGPAALPTFRFNWRQEPDGSLTTWLEVPAGDAQNVFVKEGVAEATQALEPDGNIVSQTWQGITVVDELDQLDLLDADSLTMARGVFDATLPEPA